MTCPNDLALSRAMTVGDPAIAAHVAECLACRALWRETQAAIELARLLPVALPPPARREQMRTALLASSIPRRASARPAWRVPALAAAAAAVVIGGLAIVRTAAPSSHAHGTVRPRPGASYLANARSPDEQVWLADGVIDVEVGPLHAGERYRIVVGAAEIEVRGTAFTVTAHATQLVAVTVAHGRVEVRPASGPPVSLTAGQSWHAPPPIVTAAVGAAPVAPPPPTTSTTAVPARPRRRAAAVTTPRTPQLPAPTAAEVPADAVAAAPAGRRAEEGFYDDAWHALRAGNFARAASGFARVLLLAPDSPLVEDASYWHAVALARGKRPAEAVSAFRDLLDRYPRSPRIGEASVMLGWLLVDLGAHDEAVRRFQAGIHDASPTVRDSAKAGLAVARPPR